MDVQNVSGVSANTNQVFTPKKVAQADSTTEVKSQPVREVPVPRTEVREDKNRDFAEEMMQKSIEQANHSLETYNRRIDRAVHEETKTMIYSIVDTENDEVIQEFPARKIQDMIAKMWELAGLTVDKRA